MTRDCVILFMLYFGKGKTVWREYRSVFARTWGQSGSEYTGAGDKV